jgi:hypothetical protein
MKPKTPESGVLRACKEYLELRGHFCTRINSGAFKTAAGGWFRAADRKGVPDLMGVTRDGRGLAVETKSNTGRLSGGQKEFRDGWIARGGIYVVARGIGDLQEAGL